MYIFSCSTTHFSYLYTLSLHDALPISFEWRNRKRVRACVANRYGRQGIEKVPESGGEMKWLSTIFLLAPLLARSEEHTSELQSPMYLVYSLLLDKQKQHKKR